MLTRVSISKGDMVRYVGAHRPTAFVRQFVGQVATIEQIRDASIHPNVLPRQVGTTPYWVDVRFKKSGLIHTLNLQHFLIEEVRQNIIRILD